ncbi:MAG: RNA 2',3'-cyclic phosphodiesterase [Nitrososphaerales archaeon]|nr:RNA 2',3'-cyclic phosphodiesterase [Nitrososphaerales archaeon]
MRAFVAIDVPDINVIDAMVAFQGELEATRADLKLVARESLHFTVKFLGEVTDAQAKEADARMRELKLPAEDVAVRGVGAFPSLGRPGVVWVGVASDDEAKVSGIAGPIARVLNGIGEEDRRPFQAHITVARVRPGPSRQNLEALIRANIDRPFGGVRLSEFKLKSSTLTPKGPIYSDVGVYRLG